MTRREWWIGVALIVGGLLVHAAIPRYEWRGTLPLLVRIDRWTGRAEVGRLTGGRWTSVASTASAPRGTPPQNSQTTSPTPPPLGVVKTEPLPPIGGAVR